MEKSEVLSASSRLESWFFSLNNSMSDFRTQFCFLRVFFSYNQHVKNIQVNTMTALSGIRIKDHNIDGYH